MNPFPTFGPKPPEPATPTEEVIKRMAEAVKRDLLERGHGAVLARPNDSYELIYEDAIRHALLRLELGQAEECTVFLRECVKRFPERNGTPKERI